MKNFCIDRSCAGAPVARPVIICPATPLRGLGLWRVQMSISICNARPASAMMLTFHALFSSVLLLILACPILTVELVADGNPSREVVISDLITYPGEVRVLTFRIANDFGSPFEVLRVEQSCDCFSVGVLPPRLEPGQIVECPVGLVGNPRPSAFKGSFLIIGKTGDGKVTSIRCSFSGESRDYLIWPWPGRRVDLTISDPTGGPDEWSFALLRGDHPERWDRLEVSIPSSDNPLLKATVAEVGDQWHLRMRRQSQALRGHITEKILFSFFSAGNRLSYSEERSFHLFIPGELNVKPAVLMIGLVEVGETVERMIEVSNREGAVVRGLRFTGNGPGFARAVNHEGGAAIVFSPKNQGSNNGFIDVTSGSGEVYRVPYILSGREK